MDNAPHQVPSTASSLLVTQQRGSGDPVLFVKPVGGGAQPGALPSIRDFPQHAAAAHYAERVNTHWVLVDNLTDTRCGRMRLLVFWHCNPTCAGTMWACTTTTAT